MQSEDIFRGYEMNAVCTIRPLEHEMRKLLEKLVNLDHLKVMPLAGGLGRPNPNPTKWVRFCLPHYCILLLIRRPKDISVKENYLLTEKDN